ncbi:MAG: hypothetical protein Q9227_006137 [Pyrenula ochraceoflavens]
MDPQDPRCKDLASPDLANFGVSLFIVLGIILSYVPQHARIIGRKSSFGLSPYFVLLGVTSQNCFFANILTLPKSQQDLQCCRNINGFACFAGTLGIVQVGSQWVCFLIIFFLFLLFFPRATSSTTNPAEDPEYPSTKTALAVTAISVAHAVLVAILSLYFTFGQRQYLQTYANIIGVCGTGLAAVQYLPQIYTTFLLQNLGSLSIPMMLIQTPGSFVWATSLAVRLGAAGWSTWGLLLVTGTLQAILLGMGIYFLIRDRRNSRKDSDSNSSEDDIANGLLATEETPLLEDSE